MTNCPPVEPNPRYGGKDCVAAFLEDLKGPPLWSCEHLDEFPHLLGAREMCRPEAVVCFACAALDLADIAFSCHCCGIQEPTTTVLLAVSTTGVRCSASLCAVCASLLPPDTGMSGRNDVMPASE
ncbi:MAG: hypothetical protein JWN15_2439 [Firmicutes bacterium]|nr:hypothetical protein [Bacillota bacterium]